MVVAVVAMALIFLRGNLKIFFSLPDAIVVMLYMIVIVSSLINGDRLLNNEGFKLITSLTILSFIVKFSLLRSSSLDESLLRFLLWAMLSVASLEALIGILQNYSIDLAGTSGFFKVVGTLYNPNQYAAFISPAVPIGIALYISEKKLFAKRLTLAMVLSIIFILPVTFMRSAWLGVMIGAGVFALLKYRNKLTNYFYGKKFRILTALVSLIVLLCGIVFLLYKLRPASADARILVWQVTKQMIADKPILGFGFGNYGVHYMGYQAKFFQLPQNVKNYAMVAGNMKIADNDFVQIAAELGIVGIAVFFMLLFLIYTKSYERLRHDGLSQTSENYLIGTVSSMTIFLVISFFSFPLHIAPTALTFFYLLAIISAIAGSGKNIEKQELNPSRWNKWVGRFISVAMVAIMVFVSWDIPQRVSSYKVWDNAFTLSLNSDYSDAISMYKSVYSKLNDNGKFHFMLGGTYVTAGMYKEGISELERSKRNYNDPEIYIALGTAYERLGDSTNAMANYREASYMMPPWIYPHYLMAKLYWKSQDLMLANREAQTVIDMPIKIESPAVHQMKDEMRWIKGRHPITENLGTLALGLARRKVGKPYLLGAKGADFFDCSGLISWAYETVDSTIQFETQNGSSQDIAMQDLYDYNVLHIDRYQVLPGDIAFITADSNKITHGGLFISWIDSDKFRFINASSHYGKVIVDSFSVSRITRGQRLVEFGRLSQ